MKTIDLVDNINIDFDEEEQDLVALSMKDVNEGRLYYLEQTYFDPNDNGNQGA
jgi:hypothetical protein